MTIWNVEIERVHVVGAAAQGAGADELRTLIERAIVRELGAAPLPAGRTVNASIAVTAPSLADGPGIANAIAGSVAEAGGRRSHG